MGMNKKGVHEEAENISECNKGGVVETRWGFS